MTKRKCRSRLMGSLTTEAIQYNIENLNEVIRFVGVNKCAWNPTSEELILSTHIGDVVVQNSFYIVKRFGVGYYTLPQNVFHKLYEFDK